jgi:hypothetical protein
MLEQTEGKAWYESTGIIGGIVAVIVPLATLGAKLAGWEVSIDEAGGGIVPALVTIIGGIVAIRGRVKATKVIR